MTGLSQRGNWIVLPKKPSFSFSREAAHHLRGRFVGNATSLGAHVCQDMFSSNYDSTMFCVFHSKISTPEFPSHPHSIATLIKASQFLWAKVHFQLQHSVAWEHNPMPKAKPRQFQKFLSASLCFDFHPRVPRGEKLVRINLTPLHDGIGKEPMPKG